MEKRPDLSNERTLPGERITALPATIAGRGTRRAWLAYAGSVEERGPDIN